MAECIIPICARRPSRQTDLPSPPRAGNTPAPACARSWTVSPSSSHREREEQDGYIRLQRAEFADGLDLPTRSHHLFSGVAYHNLMGAEYGAARLNRAVLEEHHAAQTV